jgi:diaminohydroxyphosphoribosylaminopyrimidine deaminase/5-amino-6-(5-phosphoribosylamino)uracil reductase
VVVAVLDPDVKVAGRGIDRLRAAGISVETGVGAALARESLAAYLHHRTTGRAMCLLKAAATLDGRTAAADGSSQWITGPEARADAHTLRAESQAILVGAGTALADRPKLTVRDVHPPPERQPLRVLLDARGRVPAEGPLFDQALAPTLVAATAAVDPAARAAWEAAGTEVVELPSDPHGGVRLLSLLGFLGNRGVLQAMVEGGPTLHGALVRAGLADRLVLYVGAKSLGEEGRPLFAGPGPRSIHAANAWRLSSLRRLGDDIRLEYAPATPNVA